MTQEMAIDLMRETMVVTLMVSGPILLVGLLIGLLVSILQAVTQIQEQTLSFVPKIVGMLVAVVLIAPWAFQQMMDFAARMFHF